MVMTTSEFYNPDRGFRIWARPEIYTGAAGSGKYIPNPGDLVVDVAQGWFIVSEVNPDTYLSTLSPWAPPSNSSDDADKLVGVGPGYSSESYRMFLDTSVTPHTMAPDTRLHSYSTTAVKYKVFLGYDINGSTGKVISALYDQSGNFLGDSVPLEDVTIPGVNNTVTTVKVPSVGYTTEALDDGELVTVVFYDSLGGQISQAQLLIKNSKAVRQADEFKVYINNIAIESPYLSAYDRQILEFPVNVTVESLPMTACVYYSDGSVVRSSIDGARWLLYGMRNYIATEPGQEFDLVLTYNLGQNETSVNLTPTPNRQLTVDYIARTIAFNGAFSAKLFVYPVWVDATTGYRLEYWLYNLDRQTYYNVTPYIELGATSAAFNPKLYGTLQTLTVALNLNNIDGRLPVFRYVQTFQIVLLASGDNNTPNWEVFATPDQPTGFGRNLQANVIYNSVNIYRLNLALGATTLPMWLDKLYYAVQPLYNPQLESQAPAPTHFVLQFVHNAYEYDVSQWNQDLIVNNDLADGELLYIRWVRKTVDNDLQLGITALPVVNN